MKISRRIRLLVFIFPLLTLNGFAQSRIINTYAGPGPLVNGAPAVTQTLDNPYGVAADGAGGFYFSSPSQHRVYGVAVDGSIRFVAGANSSGYSGDGGPATAAQLDSPYGVAVDSAGNLYIADAYNHRVRKVSTAGVISTVAGIGVGGYSGDGGPAIAAQLYYPINVAVDSAGNVYIADFVNARIRMVTAGGVISTVAGNGNWGYSGDGGPATAASLNMPSGIAVDSAGNLYIGDSRNNRVRMVTAGGIISTVAGNGRSGYSGDGDGGQATAASLNEPTGVAVDSAGNLYISDSGDNRIRKVGADGIISTAAGDNGGSIGDGGPATSARLSSPYGLAFDSAGNLYIADSENNRIRKVNAAGIISTVAGIGEYGYSGDGGSATGALLDGPMGVAYDLAGNLFIADTYNNRIRKVTPAGIISTVAGNGNSGYGGDSGQATAAQLSNPSGVAVDYSGNLFIADTYNNRIRKVTPAGIISTVAGNGTSGFSGDGSQATAAKLSQPAGVSVDYSGNLFIADSSNNRIRKVTTAGVISTVAGNGSWGYSGDGGPATTAQIGYPYGVAVDFSGNLYIADRYNYRIRKVTAGTISTFAGNGNWGYSGDGGPATAAQIGAPYGVAVDYLGNLFIADTYNYSIRMVTAAGIISTVAGNGDPGYNGDGSLATAAQLNSPYGVAVDYSGNLFIADTYNYRIRRITNIVTVDFSNDGKPDILWRNTATGENYIWYMYGNSVTGSGVLPAVADQNWKVVGIADFNNNGNPDILWRNTSTGENYIWYISGSSVTGGSVLPAVADQSWKIAGVTDFNGDGKVDILWRNSSTGQNYIWYMNGVAVTGGGLLPGVPDQNWTIVGIADFNGDCKPDILWRNIATGENYIWYMNGDAVTGGGALPTEANQDWKIIRAVNLGYSNLVLIQWRNVSTGENYLWYMNGVTVAFGGSMPVVADQAWTMTPQTQ
jgi:trimeric autotransporter adhesin